MRILRLYLKNFAHIFSGLGKYEIDLDFTNTNKTINVIVGRMGSCKTVILGSLQPFQSFGTLDVRNQDDLILPNEDGIKIIEYADGNTIYKITHNYTWNKTTHNIKSYIEKNGVELNPNGNQSSFKEIVELEFGIEQNFLRLIRLGTNVSNVINMKSTERKTFIASLLKDAEVYTYLYKKLNDDMKNLNSQTSILSNKLNHFGIKNEDEFNKKYDINKEKLVDMSHEYDSIKTKIYELRGEINAILASSTYDELKILLDTYEDELNGLHKELDESNKLIKKFDGSESISEVSKIIGGLDESISQLNKNIITTEDYYNTCSAELSKLVDKKKICNNSEQLEELQIEYESLIGKMNTYKDELRGFNAIYTVPQLIQLLGDLKSIDIMMDDVTQYDREIIKKLYGSDSSVIGWSKKQIEYLNYKKIKLQKDINNIKYSEKYEAPSKLFIPPFCPTDSCPYLKTHPYTIKQKTKSVDKYEESELDKIMGMVDELDLATSRYEVYPLLYTKIASLKLMWKQVYGKLDKIHAINISSLLSVLTNREMRQWYNIDTINTNIELAKKSELYYELVANINKVKTEMDSIKLDQGGSTDERINYLESEIDNATSQLTELEAKLNIATDKLKSYNDLYLELSKMDIYKKDNEVISNRIVDLTSGIAIIQKNIETIDIDQDILEKLQKDEVEVYSKMKLVSDENERIKTSLNDLVFTKKEFEKVLDDKENLKYILDAVSSKEGIPLILVKMFLNNCRDVVNELVSDVFGDVIEILEFKITDTEFKIPYTINGVKVDDIERASQGQQAVISIALSFALVRQSMFKYNIMLLDEIDGPLYKHDRSKFVNILMKQLHAIDGEQVFLISHNTEIFNQMNINYVCTTDEIIDKNTTNSVMYV